jgi:pilus assembly protein CpaC
MFHRITDEPGTPGVKRIGRCKDARIASIGLIGAALISMTISAPRAVLAQEGGAEDNLGAKVLDMSERLQRISVPFNRSVTVETAVEVMRANVVNSTIADVQVLNPKRILITGGSYGVTNVVLLGSGNEQTVFEVSVELDLDRLNEAIKQIDPQSTARADSVQTHVVLTGSVSSAERVQRIVELAALFVPGSTGERGAGGAVRNHLEVAGEQQVLLRVLVAEVNRTATRELGVNGYLIGENFRDGFLVNQLGGINPVNIGAAGGLPVTRDLPFVTDENGLVLRTTPTLSLGFPRVQMQLFLRALASNSLLKVLAEPNLVAISGETATFLAGGEFPVPVPQGFQTVTIEYREFGVRLNFTPQVRGHQRIRLRVAPEVSELDFANAVQFEGFVIPALTSRASETTIELGNGETIAMAGLLSEQVRAIASRIPGIGDVPVLGTLFRSVNFQRSVSELVILVTPEIVAPMDAHQTIKIPGSDVVSPTDAQLYLLGLVEGPLPDKAPSLAMGNGNGNGTEVSTESSEMSVHGPWGHAR